MTAAEVEQQVLLEVAEGVATVSLNRPDKLNAVTPAMAVRLTELLHGADRDARVRVIVLRGNGRGFCSGADLSVLRAGTSALATFVADPTTNPTVALHLRKPVIVAAKGPMAGIGVAFVAAADVRFAESTATFTTSFARLGLVAEYGLSWLLPRAVGRAAAADLLLSGRTIDAGEAARIGLVNSVVDTDDLDAHVHAYAADLAEKCSPRSMAVIKDQLRLDAHSDFDSAFHRSLVRMTASFEARDLTEALAAFGDRRPPHFPDLVDVAEETS